MEDCLVFIAGQLCLRWGLNKTKIGYERLGQGVVSLAENGLLSRVYLSGVWDCRGGSVDRGRAKGFYV